MTPPAPPPCLTRLRADKYKGGTCIAEDVHDFATHLRRLADPDGYRPERCARCLCATLHINGYPERLLLGDGGGVPVVRIVQYLCARLDCGATWRVLPLFLARHLWRTWRTVERATLPADTPAPRDAPKIPERTERRWRGRLAMTARLLIVVLATSGSAQLAAICRDLDATRGELVTALSSAATVAPGARLARLAALVDRLARGIRLM